MAISLSVAPTHNIPSPIQSPVDPKASANEPLHFPLPRRRPLPLHPSSLSPPSLHAPTPLPTFHPSTLPQHHHSARRRHALSPPCIKHFHSSAAAMRITSAANPQSLPISLLSFFGCQFLIFSNLSESFATGAKHVESIVTILLQIKHLLHKRFSQQWMQVLFLMCGTVLSLILPLVQAIVIAASPDSTMINFRLIIAGGVVTGLVVKLFWARLIRPWLPTCRH